MMIAMNLPEKSVRDLLDYTNEFIDNACSQKFIREAEANKSRLKKAIVRIINVVCNSRISIFCNISFG